MSLPSFQRNSLTRKSLDTFLSPSFFRLYSLTDILCHLISVLRICLLFLLSQQKKMTLPNGKTDAPLIRISLTLHYMFTSSRVFRDLAFFFHLAVHRMFVRLSKNKKPHHREKFSPGCGFLPVRYKNQPSRSVRMPIFSAILSTTL